MCDRGETHDLTSDESSVGSFPLPDMDHIQDLSSGPVIPEFPDAPDVPRYQGSAAVV